MAIPIEAAGSSSWRAATSTRSRRARRTTSFGRSDSTDRSPITSLFVGQYLASGGVTSGPFQVSGDGAASRDQGTHLVHPVRRTPPCRPVWSPSRCSPKAQSPLTPSQAQATRAPHAVRSRRAVRHRSRIRASGTFERVLGDTVSGAHDRSSGGLSSPGRCSSSPATTASRWRAIALGARTSMRAEAGIRLGDLWISGGVIRRGADDAAATRGAGPAIPSPARACEPKARRRRGTISVRGRLFKALYADAWGIAWNDTTGFYRPRYQSRSELYIQTNLLNRFPSGNFGLLTSLAHEYRSTRPLSTARRRPRSACAGHARRLLQARDPHPDGGRLLPVPQPAPGAVPAGPGIPDAASDAVLRREMGFLELTISLSLRNLRRLI